MRKSLLLSLVFLLMLTGCGSSKSAEEIISEGFDNNDGSEIVKLIKSTNDIDAVEKLIVDTMAEKTTELSNMSIEDYEATPYGSAVFPGDFTEETLESNNFKIFLFLEPLLEENGNVRGEELQDAMNNLGLTTTLKAIYVQAMDSYEIGDYFDAYSKFNAVSNSRDSGVVDVLQDTAQTKAGESEEKILSESGVTVNMAGSLEVGDIVNSLSLNYTNNTGKDIKEISGYAIAYDKEGYPIKEDDWGEYYFYFSMSDQILKNGSSIQEDAYPDSDTEISSCKFLITSIKYLSGGDYNVDSSNQDKLLQSWTETTIE